MWLRHKGTWKRGTVNDLRYFERKEEGKPYLFENLLMTYEIIRWYSTDCRTFIERKLAQAAGLFYRLIISRVKS